MRVGVKVSLASLHENTFKENVSKFKADATWRHESLSLEILVLIQYFLDLI